MGTSNRTNARRGQLPPVFAESRDRLTVERGRLNRFVVRRSARLSYLRRGADHDKAGMGGRPPRKS
jgi:hypothetical protein